MSRHRGTPAQPEAGTKAGRGRSIRASLITLAVVPATAMVLLWVSGSYALFDQWHNANSVGQAAKTTYALVPAVGEFQKERQLTISLLASHGSSTALEAQRRRTDAVLAGFRKADSASDGEGSAQYRAQLTTVRERLTRLATERTAVDGGKASRQDAYTVYSDAVASVLNLFGMLSLDAGDAATAAGAGHALAFLRGAEALTQEEAILGGVAGSGKLSVQERSELADAEAVRDSVLSNEVEPYLPTDLGAQLGKAMSGSDWTAMAAFEKTVGTASAAHDGTIAVPSVPAARAAAPGRVSGAVQAVEGQYLDKVTKDSAHRTHMVLVKAMLGSAVALVAVLAVALLSWRIARSLLGRMSRLRTATLELADERLPELITRLRTQGKRAELDDLPELDFGTDELGKVAEAFNSAQRTAVSVALEQASLREGARLVFHNMSRRIQLLVHRQLTVIDSMERKEQDPELLSDLYRVDHLATRMRRNAESLTVLSGAAPRRRWKHAVPLADLLRSAVSEIEGYARVVVEPLPPIAVLGPAVGDTIHLMAELIENGVTFSPPHTEVRVRALPVAQGYAIEVEDRGLGLSADEYAAANELLHHPKDFSFTTLGEDPRLGLFTVGHLAQRHGVTASLQASSYGGSLAVVVLPHALTEPAADTLPPTLDARAERHLASVAGSATGAVTGSGSGSVTGLTMGSGQGQGQGSGSGNGSGRGPAAGTDTGSVTGPVSGSGRGGVTAGGMPMRVRTRPGPQTQSTSTSGASARTSAGPGDTTPFADSRETGSSADSRGSGASADFRTAGSSSDFRTAGLAGDAHPAGSFADSREAGPFADSREAGSSAGPRAGGPFAGSRDGGSSADRSAAGFPADSREAGPFGGSREGGPFADSRETGSSAGPRAGGPFAGARDGGASAGPRADGSPTGPRGDGLPAGSRAGGPFTGARDAGVSAGPRADAPPAGARGLVPFPHSRVSGAASGSPSDAHPAAPSPGARAGGGSSRLPRRVRQAHLAPQLRARPSEADGEYGAGREAERRPEQARSMLAALRDGTRRARAEEVPAPAWPASLRGDAPRPASPREGTPRPPAPRAETPAPTWNTAPPERRQLPTRPRPTRNTP
ncbi:nitrate- and nitrite sensing domain-containing protein [Streptomyces sp. NBC_01478]|uniref:sensor histidine kinase n=1 Tax=Streptomyces sp. NBC_01478 TaxID=2903882 RepID=UPI002E3284CB|nr:nitrate- and nitrite sensing domain-containing protein [Streptomyces sp. NBC_01478]